MKIIKYEKMHDGNYQVYLDNNKKIIIHEDIILKHKLLYKEEIDDKLYKLLEKENNDYDIYNKCVKYIAVRLRSIHEIRGYMKRKNISNELIQETIDKLLVNNYLDDERFTKAFINDKLNFTTMGPYRIQMELKKHNIDNSIIVKYINEIDKNQIDEKINKQITKLMKSNKNRAYLKNKIYNNLINLGYQSDVILDNLRKYDI